jgi:hypothetical protein
MSDSVPETSEKILSRYVSASLVRAATFLLIADVTIIQGSFQGNSRAVLYPRGRLPPGYPSLRSMAQSSSRGCNVCSEGGLARRLFILHAFHFHHVMPMQIGGMSTTPRTSCFPNRPLCPSKKRVADRAYCPFQISGSCPIYRSGVAPADGRAYDPSQSDKILI